MKTNKYARRSWPDEPMEGKTRWSTAWCKKKSCMFEFAAFLPPTNLGLPMHSPSALTEHVSLNLARFFLLDPVSMSTDVSMLTYTVR